MIGKFCLFRGRDSGVHTGTLESINYTPSGSACLIRGHRRIWEWSGAFSLNEIATNGISESSKISAVIEEDLVTDVIEVIPCTAQAQANLVRSRNNPSGV